MAIIPLDKRDGYIWLNGEFLDWKNAKIHILTHSLHYGGAVFEGIRAYNGKIFKLREHIERLFASAEILKFKPDFSIAQICGEVEKLLLLNNLNNCYIRPLLWRGSESMRINSPMLSVNAMIAAWDVNFSEFRKAELDIVVSKWKKASNDSLPPRCKSSANYQMAIVAQSDAIEEGFDDALLLDQNNCVSECTVSNIFFVDGNNIITPTIDSILPGITRATVLEIAKLLGLNYEEKRIRVEDLSEFNEAFITGTAVEIKPIKSITSDGKKFDYNSSDITIRIQNEYNKLVGKI